MASGGGFHNDATASTMHSDNVDFTGNAIASPQVTLDGQLLIGSTTAPHIQVNTLTAGTGITVTNGHGTITVAATGAGMISTIAGDTGSVSGSTVHLLGNTSSANSGATVRFTASSGTELDLNTSDAAHNTLVGAASGNATLSGNQNTALGYNTLHGLTTGTRNTAVGYQASLLTTIGVDNVAIGNALPLSTADSQNVAVGTPSLADLNGGSNNVAVGSPSLQTLLTGAFNVAIGSSVGSNYGGAESSNILLNSAGVATENNVLRIGAGTGAGNQQLTTAFISGINGNTVSSASYVTINSSTDQLGVAAIPATFSWSDNSGAFAAVSFHGYFITTTSTATLPASPAEGDQISFIVDTTNILTITANTGQHIRIGTALSAAAGTAANNARGDSITLVYRSTGTTWFSLGSPEATWTVT
jgi:hypothetical protein